MQIQLQREMSEGRLREIDLPLAGLDSSQKRHKFHDILISEVEVEGHHAQFPRYGVLQVLRRISLLCTYGSLKSLWQLQGEMSEGCLLETDLP